MAKSKRFIPTDIFGGGSLQGYFETSFEKLVELFGEPNAESDGYKVSTEWNLKSPSGKIVTIYDYKSTNMYDLDEPSVEEFRALPSYEWHIGGQDVEEANELIEYLKEKTK